MGLSGSPFEANPVFISLEHNNLPRRINIPLLSFVVMRLWGKKENRCEACGAKFDSEEKLAEHGKAHTPPMTATQ